VSPRDWKGRIQDILDAIAEIEAFAQGMDFDAFKSDTKTVRAVELNLIVIGEAANRIPELVEGEHPQIPWSLMRAMRNRLVHAYFEVDEKLLWDTVNKDLPLLINPLQALLR